MRSPALFLLALMLASNLAHARDTWSDPHPHVRRLLRVTNAPVRAHVLVVDLTAAAVAVRASRRLERNRVVSRFARDHDLQLAVNGDFFDLNTREPTGLAVGRGQHWAGTEDTGEEGFVAVGRDNRAQIFPPSAVVERQEWMAEVVSGRPLVLRGGEVTNVRCVSHYCDRHPRTAVGLDQAGETLYLAVVDGRSNASRGMTVAEVGALLRSVGAHIALNLDGGGSSAMYVEGAGGIVNRPSDGSERRVANSLGVSIRETTGTVKGFVRVGDVHGDEPVSGALVQLSTGVETTPRGDGLFLFEGVHAGVVDVRGSAPGFVDAMRTVEVVAGEEVWASLAMTPLRDSADVGVPQAADAGRPGTDAGRPGTDADTGTDAATATDTDSDTDTGADTDTGTATDIDVGVATPTGNVGCALRPVIPGVSRFARPRR